MATGIPIPRGCCSVFSASPHPLVRNPTTSLSPVPRPVTHLGLFLVSPAFPFSWVCRAALAPRPSLSRSLFPSSRVYTPPGRQQPFGAGPLAPHPFRDRFMRLARVAPFPPPSLSPVPPPVTLLGLFPASRAFPCSLGCCAALATRPSLSLPLFPSSRLYTPAGRQQPFWRGPTGSSSIRAPFHVPSTGRSLPASFRLGGVFPSGPFGGPSSWPPLPPVPVPFPHLVTCCCCCFFRAPPAVPRLLVCYFPFRRCLLALCFTPSGGALGSCFFCLFFRYAPPLSRCASCLVVPSSLHARTSALHWSSGHGSPRCSSPVPSPSWGVALGGPRPCQVGSPPSRHSPLFPLFPPLSSVSRPPSYCCSPAPCAPRWSFPRQGCILRALTRPLASALSSDL